MGDRCFTRMQAEPLSEAEVREFLSVPAAGGVVVFSGVVRNRDEGRGVLRIEYSAAAELAARKLREIASDVLAGGSAERVAALHRTGMVSVGEASVVAGASAVHREDAFRAARELIDRIKEALPVWKKQHFQDGTSGWVEGFTVQEADR